MQEALLGEYYYKLLSKMSFFFCACITVLVQVMKSFAMRYPNNISVLLTVLDRVDNHFGQFVIESY